jgi:PAS domain S-box-containing protein
MSESTPKNQGSDPPELFLRPELDIGRLHGFIRRHGLIKTTAFFTLFGVIASLVLCILVFAIANRPFTGFAALVAILNPMICTPIIVTSMLHLLLRLDHLDEVRRHEQEERTKADNALREREARFRAVFEKSRDYIYFCDYTGTISLSNEGPNHDLGYGDEIIGMSLSELLGEALLPTWLDEIIERGQGTIECDVLKKNGEKLRAVVTATSLGKEQEELQVVIHDITEQQQVEQVLRTAKESSEEANRLKSRFVFNVSHEIRTPLSGILGFAETIMTETSLERAQSHALTILNETETLLMLVTDLLDLAKIESGKMEIDPQPLDVTHLASSAISPLVNMARTKNLRLNWSIQPGTPLSILADFTRLRQVMLNLLGNAIKFTHKGYVELMVSLLERQDEEPKLLFTVADTGIGIEESKQEAIFRSFTQADASTTREYGGTGLGTTIARELVNLMGGEIGVISLPNAGSTFWFTIPFREVPPDHVSPNELLQQSATLPSKRVGKILLAEDYPTNQTITRLQLESAGHEVVVVENGALALRACEEEAFDLILMDIQMPVMDGREATQRIRKSSSRNASTPILAMTASAETSTRETCLEAGMNDTIVKPLRRESLLEVIAHWLDGDSREQGTSLRESASSKIHPNEPLDVIRALAQFANNRPLLVKTLGRFIDQTERDLDDMRKTLALRDFDVLRKEAHKIKGAAAYLAAQPLARAIAELEDKARDRQEEAARSSIALVERELSRLRRAYSHSVEARNN